MHHENRHAVVDGAGVAAELGVSISTAHKWSAAGARSVRFPVRTNRPDGCIRIRRDWLEAWLTEHEVN